MNGRKQKFKQRAQVGGNCNNPGKIRWWLEPEWEVVEVLRSCWILDVLKIEMTGLDGLGESSVVPRFLSFTAPRGSFHILRRRRWQGE